MKKYLLLTSIFLINVLPAEGNPIPCGDGVTVQNNTVVCIVIGKPDKNVPLPNAQNVDCVVDFGSEVCRKICDDNIGHLMHNYAESCKQINPDDHGVGTACLTAAWNISNRNPTNCSSS